MKAVNDAVKHYVSGENIAFADGPGASSTVIVGFTSDEVAHLLQAAGTAAEGRVSELANQLNASREAVLGFFSILKEEQVPGAQLSGKLEEIAQRHMELVKSLAEPPEKDIPQANLDEAEELLSRAASTEDYDQVDRLLASAQSGFTIDAQVKGGLVLVQRGQLSLTRLDYMKAGEYFLSAGELLDNITPMSVPTLNRAMRAFIKAGEDTGNQLAFEKALGVSRIIDRHVLANRLPNTEAQSASKHNIGMLLMTLGESSESLGQLKEAVDSFNLALQHRSETGSPLPWATTQKALGKALALLSRDEDGPLMEQAMCAYENALRVFSTDSFPEMWGQTQEDLGNVLETLGGKRLNIEEMQAAARAYRNALRFSRREANEVRWGGLQYHLGRVQSRFNRVEEKTEAVGAFRLALEVFTPTDHVVHYTLVNDELSYTLFDLALLQKEPRLLEASFTALHAAWPYYKDDPETNALYESREIAIRDAYKDLSKA